MVGALHYADALLTISEAAKLDILRLAEIIGQKSPPISVVPLGSTIDYLEEAHDAPDGVIATGCRPLSPVVKELSTKPFVLCVGTVEVRKNHMYLFRIWKMLLEKHGDSTPRLVIVGRRGWLVDDFFRQLEQTRYLDGKIVILTGINDDDLSALYAHSSFTVFPSLYEGWGLPVGESLAHGKLCVASSASSVPEVGGEFALYVDPYNVRDGFARIESLILNPDEVRMHEKKIKKKYTPLSWAKAAGGLMALLERITNELDSVDRSRIHPVTGGLPVLSTERRYRIGSLAGKAWTGGNHLVAGAAATLSLLIIEEALSPDHWYKTENWGRWSKVTKPRIAFSPDIHSDTGFAIFLEVKLPPGVGTFGCSVKLNGEYQGDWELSGDGKPGVITLETTPDRASKGKTKPPEIVIDFDLGEKGGAMIDGRFLGLGLISVSVCRADDLLRRIRYVEALNFNTVKL